MNYDVHSAGTMTVKKQGVEAAPDYYKWFCQQVHGLGHEGTDDMDYPEFVIHDTLAAPRKHCRGQLENHHALADAEACAWIARGIL